MAGKTTKMLILLALIALAGVGCSDDQTTNPTIADTAPPVPPTNLTAEYSPVTGFVTLRWEANFLDQDLAGFIVAKELVGEIAALVSTPTLYQVYEDKDVRPGVTKYYVYAVKTPGNESAPATVLVQVSSSHAVDRPDVD